MQFRRRFVIGAVAVSVLALGLTHATAATAPSGLLLSKSANRSGAVSLSGQTLSGNVYIFYRSTVSVTSVKFYVDDMNMQRAPYSVEPHAPWDFAHTAAGNVAGPFATSKLSNGSHTITAVSVSARSTKVTAKFTVKNNGATSSSNPLANAQFYGVSEGAQKLANSDPIMARLAKVGAAKWLTGGSPQQVQQDVTSYLASVPAGKTAVFVAYNIPGRDCGNFSAGGAGSATAYNAWIDAVAKGIGSKKAVVVVEPDVLMLACGDMPQRYAMLNHAVDALGKTGAITYLDAGHSNDGKDPALMADRLKQAGVAKARGFSVNVSNFQTTANEVAEANQVVAALGGHKGYVVDTSRNGNGAYNGSGDTSWCNPPGRALGTLPTSKTGTAADAYLWIKVPGESDGTCSGHATAGIFEPDVAKAMAQAAGWK